MTQHRKVSTFFSAAGFCPEQYIFIFVCQPKLRPGKHDPLEFVTVLGDTGFSFPTPDFYQDLEMELMGSQLAVVYKRMLSTIARPFMTRGSWEVMTTRVALSRSVRFRRGSVFQYCRYSTGNLRGEAPHELQHGDLPPRNAGGSASSLVRSYVSCWY